MVTFCLSYKKKGVAIAQILTFINNDPGHMSHIQGCYGGADFADFAVFADFADLVRIQRPTYYEARIWRGSYFAEKSILD